MSLKNKQTNKKHSFVDGYNRPVVDRTECGKTSFIQHWGKTFLEKPFQSEDKVLIFVSATPGKQLLKFLKKPF